MPTALKSTLLGADVVEYIYGPGQTERQQWISDFIHIVDPWMPFIPISELRTRLLSESRQLKREDILLLACIKLKTEPLSEGQPVNKQYLAVKSRFISAEIYSTLSIRPLQASLLLLLYEQKHGVYPSAYKTIGGCARYLGALDIETGSYPSGWIDGEQRR